MPYFIVWTARGKRVVKIRNVKSSGKVLSRIAFQIHNSLETTRPAFVEMIDTLNWQEML